MSQADMGAYNTGGNSDEYATTEHGPPNEPNRGDSMIEVEDAVTTLKFNERSKRTVEGALENLRDIDRYGVDDLIERVEEAEPMEEIQVTADDLDALETATQPKLVAGGSADWENARMRIEEKARVYGED